MIQEEENIIAQGEEFRSKGKRIQLDPNWVRDGDKTFIDELISGKFDTNVKGISREEKLTNDLKRMKITEDHFEEEQGNRLV